MRRPEHQIAHGEELFIGIDLHKQRWHVTIESKPIGEIAENWRSC